MTSGKKKFVISIYSPLGGQGASFITSQLVHQFARSGPSCLLDLNLDYSMSLHYLNVVPSDAFRKSALSSGESVLLSSFATKVEDNYFAVAAPLIGYGQFAEETAEATKELFELCRAEFDFTVIDLPQPLHVELTKTALSLSDLIIVLSENTNHSARSCVKLKQIFADPKMNIDAKKLSFLFNRTIGQESTAALIVTLQVAVLVGVIKVIQYLRPEWLSNPVFIGVAIVLFILVLIPKTKDQSKSALSILESNQIRVFHQLPSDQKNCRMLINQGKFLDDKTKIGRSMMELAEKIKGLLNK